MKSTNPITDYLLHAGNFLPANAVEPDASVDA
ncbi:hypothetical protein BSFP_067750 [Burkholderia stabilis]|uniref:Uncharacterized protein n=1 Tax=Burkholderia stabilis TaxID=95485 RepID=A0A1Y1BV36_9BURK|nr:hypothetical protein BSFP_067750 [Burkholderia stabilis]